MANNENEKMIMNQQVRKKFLTYKQAAELYSMGLNKIQEHARKAGAVYKRAMRIWRRR